jgi:MipA family protein
MNSYSSPSSFRPSAFMGAVVSALTLTLASPAFAFGDNEQITDIQKTPGSAGLGYVLRVEPSPYKDATTRLEIKPLFLYEGERVFLHSSRVGVKLFDSPEQRLDVFLDKRLEGFPIKSPPASLSGMAIRHSSTDAGLSYRYRQPWGTLQAELLHGVSDTQSGTEARLGYSNETTSGRWTLRPSVTLAWRNAKLNDYYYGVTPGEATAARPAYSAGAGLNASVGLYTTYQLSQNWRLLGGASATLLSSQIKDSPVVSKRFLPAVYVGAAYDFGAPRPRSTDAGGTPTYVKLLYGSATDDGCHLVKIVTARCFSTTSSNRTDIQAIQVGKPFVENFNGWPVDLVGYVGLTRHDERGLQANGMQVDAFMKAYYHGFPWASRVKTRLGFGAGVSLAQRVPYIEASSAAIANDPSSRLLQYMEPTLDVSLGDIIGARSLKDTYIGVGVAHRSGIFGSSRLLGNVNGGSNYIYGYVESAF